MKRTSPSSFVLRVAAVVVLFGATAGDVLSQQRMQLPTRDRQLPGAPEHVFTVGQAEGESWEMFSRIRGVAFDAVGNLYVLDAGNHRVILFDQQGRFRHQFGRRGEGPGEFRNPWHIAVTTEGEILVLDIGNRALVVFSLSGEFLRQVSVADIADPPASIYAAPGGVFALSRGRESPEGRYARLYILPAESGEPVREVTAARLPDMIPMDLRSNEMGISRLRRTPVYSPDAYLAVSIDGAAALQTDVTYQLRVFDQRGSHIRTVVRALPPQPVTKAIRDAWLSAWSRTRVESGASADLPYDPPFAEVMSQVTALRADMNGRIWVRRRAGDGEEDGPIDLVTLAGEYKGTLRNQVLPIGFGPDWRMAVVATDELGVERVIISRQPHAWR